MTPQNPPSLAELFFQLETPAATETGSNCYMTTPIVSSATYRLGKDPSGAPSLLIQSSLEGLSDTPPIRLRHLRVMHDVNCVVYSSEHGKKSGKFSVISCVEADQVTEMYFLKIVEVLFLMLGENPDAQSINQAIDQLVELFRALYRPSIKTAQGLWAELFLIAESQNPDALVDAWHIAPDDLYDFSNDNCRIEVKSTSGDVRRHRFSLAQLQPSPGINLVIASILVKRTGEGTTIQGLIEDIRARLASPGQAVHLYKIATMTLGDKWHESALEAFDLSTAKHSLAFFKPDDIPAVDPNVPLGVSDVHFLSDLTGKSPCSGRELTALGGLIASSIPR